MERVRIGVIGLGNMGSSHIKDFIPKVDRLELTAVCDIVPSKMHRYEGPAKFERSTDLIRSGLVDAVLVATPHYDHTTIGIDALSQGLHVLVEKPISVHKADCERLIAAHRGQVFSAMFNQRTDEHYKTIRDLVQSGELGQVQRINWIITNWFRSDAYYASGGWRATWAGEGGGVLLNQCPHNLDLYQWMFGMPSRVTAVLGFGKFHDIEVEDEVHAILEHPGGAVGIFATTTGELPGTNRLEVVGDRGRLVYENGKIIFNRTPKSVKEFKETTPGLFDSMSTWTCDIPGGSYGEQHLGILKNFTAAILDGTPLIAPAPEGIHSVELANAMILSGLTKRSVELPLDGAEYEARLKELIAGSRHEKKVAEVHAGEMASSFRR